MNIFEKSTSICAMPCTSSCSTWQLDCVLSIVEQPGDESTVVVAHLDFSTFLFFSVVNFAKVRNENEMMSNIQSAIENNCVVLVLCQGEYRITHSHVAHTHKLNISTHTSIRMIHNNIRHSVEKIYSKYLHTEFISWWIDEIIQWRTWVYPMYPFSFHSIIVITIVIHSQWTEHLHILHQSTAQTHT